MTRKGMLAALLVFAFLGTTLGRASAAPEVVAPLAFTLENFESYADDAALQAAWPAYDGTPQQSLGSVPHGGEQSLQIDYELTVDPFFETVARSLGAGVDLSTFSTLTIWFQGLPANGHDGLYVAFIEDGSPSLEAGSGFENRWTDDAGWQRWDIDLSTAVEPLDAVTHLVLGVELLEVSSSGLGTVYIDDISLSSGLETVWLGGSSDWFDPANWDLGTPLATTNARIPAAPAGGSSFPLLDGPGAAVHDLLIENGASLDLGQHELAVSGTLTNQGTLSQKQAVGANATVPFLTLGANPGLIINSESFLDLSPNAPAALATGLGETAVSIRGAQVCDRSGQTVLRCFDVAPASTGSAVTVTFFFAYGELNQQECAVLSLFHWKDEQWSQIGTVENRQCATDPYSVTVSGVGDFSPFALAEETPVAVGLHDFSASGPAAWWVAAAAAAAGLLLLVWPALRAGDRLWAAARRLTGL